MNQLKSLTGYLLLALLLVQPLKAQESEAPKDLDYLKSLIDITENQSASGSVKFVKDCYKQIRSTLQVLASNPGFNMMELDALAFFNMVKSDDDVVVLLEWRQHIEGSLNTPDEMCHILIYRPVNGTSQHTEWSALKNTHVKSIQKGSSDTHYLFNYSNSGDLLVTDNWSVGSWDTGKLIQLSSCSMTYRKHSDEHEAFIAWDSTSATLNFLIHNDPDEVGLDLKINGKSVFSKMKLSGFDTTSEMTLFTSKQSTAASPIVRYSGKVSLGKDDKFKLVSITINELDGNTVE
ncbi:hypothetical protein KEM09_20080 [Carboxylicivirga mesophila]|uniref:Uncharacterized protein n=1 Tax=Carboxylicivirga mesophila TaxID=1166478 RepID=A0ABS5KFN9_9BACT|nr:hypothetical protein [Carboxylicivirga mesophila]MBS2213717.1 hypothetical protein [Carboxylicivirga mesophila]